MISHLPVLTLNNTEVLGTANISSARPTMLPIIRNPKVHFCIQNSPPLVATLNHMNPVSTFPEDI
jgi:hypothetical protein